MSRNVDNDYKLTIKHYNSLDNVGGKYPDVESSDTIKPLDFVITKNGGRLERDVYGNTKKMEITASTLLFKRKLYEPNEITANITLSVTDGSNRPTLSEIREMFLKKPVELEVNITVESSKGEKDKEAGDENNIKKVLFTNFFVYEVKPEYKQSSSTDVNLTLKIYSLDKLMDLDKYSQAYLGRKLKGEILKSVNRFVLPYKYKREDSIVTDTTQVLKFNDSLSADSGSNEKKKNYIEDFRLQHLAYGTSVRTKDKDGNSFTDENKNEYTIEVQNEYIQPYLVQYNESFYSFIKRISNRCGEFIYFDNGCLNIGLRTTPDSDMVIPENDPFITQTENKVEKLNLTGYSTLSFENMSEGVINTKDYYRDSLKNALDKFSKKGTINATGKSRQSDGEHIYKFSGGENEVTYPTNTNFFLHDNDEDQEEVYPYNNELANDEFFMPLYAEGFGGTEFQNVNLGSNDKIASDIIGSLLNSTSLVNFVFNVSYAYTMKAIVAERYGTDMNERGQERFIDTYSVTSQPNSEAKNDDVAVVVPFSEDEIKRWTTLEYYSDIRIYEERQQRLMATIGMDSNVNDLRLGDIFQLEEDQGTPYIACDIEISFLRQSSTEAGGETVKVNQLIKAIPMLKVENGWKAFPPVIDEDVIRRSGPQTAFVVDAADPKKQNRVRIRFPWQTTSESIPAEDIFIPEDYKEIWDEYTEIRKKAATPWIRMSTPSATTDAGIYFEAEPGDEVIVNFENDNIERPYVVGALYSKDMPAPTGKGRRVIISKFGHMIRFKDPSDGVGEISDATGVQRVMGQISPLLDLIGTVTKWTWGGANDNDTVNKMTGGIDIGDAYGLYKISMSSDERAININSPFGDISLNALTGINISAPNGNIKISGKNIDIVASNNVNIESGKNLENGATGFFTSAIKTDGAGFRQNLKSTVDSWANIISDNLIQDLQPLDLGLIRNVLEIFVRPVNGTLAIKSHGFVTMEAGKGEVQIPYTAYNNRYKEFAFKDDEPQKVEKIVRKLTIYFNTSKRLITNYKRSIAQLLQSLHGKIKTFHDTYIRTEVLEDFNSDRLLESLYADNSLTFSLSSLGRQYIEDSVHFHGDDATEFLEDKVKEIQKKYDEIYDGIDALRALINPDITLKQHSAKWFDETSGLDDRFVKKLESSFKKDYNNDVYLLGKTKELLNAQTAKRYLDPENNQLDGKRLWITDTLGAWRHVIIDLLNDFKTLFPKFKLTYEAPIEITRAQPWLNSIDNLDIEIDQDAVNHPLALDPFIEWGNDLSDLVSAKSKVVWDKNSGAGKILFSDHKGFTKRIDSHGNIVNERNVVKLEKYNNDRVQIVDIIKNTLRHL